MRKNSFYQHSNNCVGQAASPNTASSTWLASAGRNRRSGVKAPVGQSLGPENPKPDQAPDSVVVVIPQEPLAVLGDHNCAGWQVGHDWDDQKMPQAAVEIPEFREEKDKDNKNEQTQHHQPDKPDPIEAADQVDQVIQAIHDGPAAGQTQSLVQDTFEDQKAGAVPDDEGGDDEESQAEEENEDDDGDDGEEEDEDEDDDNEDQEGHEDGQDDDQDSPKYDHNLPECFEALVKATLSSNNWAEFSLLALQCRQKPSLAELILASPAAQAEKSPPLVLPESQKSLALSDLLDPKWAQVVDLARTWRDLNHLQASLELSSDELGPQDIEPSHSSASSSGSFQPQAGGSERKEG
ncbi:MAG: hypothetical protein LBT47_09270 [Deltaproteobacteria bacterium]|jgi:hypothetical protein|nr:hypothetical protein [Deltaproteobacteria bacterium]